MIDELRKWSKGEVYGNFYWKQKQYLLIQQVRFLVYLFRLKNAKFLGE